MFDKFKRAFGGGGDDGAPRTLETLEDLAVGDYVEFGFLDLSALSGKRFKVERINWVNYGEGLERSMVLSAGSTVIGLSPDKSEGEQGFMVTLLLTRKQVEATFDMEAFAGLFDEGHVPMIPVVQVAEPLRDWIDAGGYRETVDCLRSQFREGDTGPFTAFDFYELTGKEDDTHTIEVEVYDSDTEVYACRWMPMRAIEKLWPAGVG